MTCGARWEKETTPLTAVVTAFLYFDERILVVRRSDRVGTYRGAWAGISGYVERLPLDQALLEVWEETGLRREDVILRGVGIPIVVDDPGLGHRWLVHPFLLEARDLRRFRTDWEADQTRWILPGEVVALETVPGLDLALASVWPPFGDEAFWGGFSAIATDTRRGATALALSALGELHEYLARDADAPYERAVRALAACRPSMAVFPHLAARLLTPGTDTGRLPTELEATAARSAANAAKAIAGYGTVLTISYSSAVRSALLSRAESGERLRVVVAESRPEMEGLALAEDLAREGLDVTVITDAEAGLFAGRVDCILVGADAITDEGQLQNKAGTSLLVLAARARGVPCFAVTQTYKISPPSFPVSLEEQEPDSVGSAPGVRFRNVVFDTTPLAEFDAVYTEDGVLESDRLAEVRSDLAAAGLLPG